MSSMSCTSLTTLQPIKWSTITWLVGLEALMFCRTQNLSVMYMKEAERIFRRFSQIALLLQHHCLSDCHVSHCRARIQSNVFSGYVRVKALKSQQRAGLVTRHLPCCLRFVRGQSPKAFISIIVRSRGGLLGLLS